MAIVEVKNIYKSYDKGKIKALQDISLSVDKGELYGLIGPDGAGKTTLIRIIASLLIADSGSATLAGFDVVTDYLQIRSIIGYMPGKFSLYQDLSVEENLQFFATVFNTTIKENFELIKDLYVQLEPFKSRRAGKLSGGMKQKLALCCALIHEPKVLLLDEPTTGVDPVSRKEFWEMLIKLKAKGITIIVSTPYMDEAAMCDRISLIQNGKILETGTPAAVTKYAAHKIYAVKAESMYELMKSIRLYPSLHSCYAFGDSHHVQLEDDDIAGLTGFLEQKGIKDTQIKEIAPGIEDIFMEKMNLAV